MRCHCRPRPDFFDHVARYTNQEPANGQLESVATSNFSLFVIAKSRGLDIDQSIRNQKVTSALMLKLPIPIESFSYTNVNVESAGLRVKRSPRFPRE
jgi:hypothetical protein